MSIVLNYVSKTIRGIEVLQNVSLRMDAGRVTGLEGVNGSGKTMVMRVIAGLVKPTSGTVEIDGRELGELMAFPPSIGLLIENPAFLPSRSGTENLELLASINNRIGSEQIEQVIAMVGLDPHDRRPFKKYSLGMKQRLGIAAAIMESPDIVLLDEPTNALDSSGVTMVKRVVAAQRARGATVVLTCHDREILYELADEVYAMAEGRIQSHMTLKGAIKDANRA